MAERPIEPGFRILADPSPCGYLPDRAASLEYRLIESLDAEQFACLLARGWRRFGQVLFRPRCQGCRECRPIRIDVTRFQPNRSQRRNPGRNADVQIELAPATFTPEHLRLHNAYHADMHVRRGWPESDVGRVEYRQMFLRRGWTFAQEFRYYRQGQLAGVALCDVVPEALSAVYFYHDPDWRPLGPGVFSILNHIRYARETGRRWVYLGFWVAGCQSMNYKRQFTPHELLTEFVEDEEPADWREVDSTEE